VNRAQEDFEQQVDAWVNEALKRGNNTFGGLLSSLPGVFPTAALSSVHRLHQRRHIGAALARKLHRQARTACEPTRLRSNALLPPHPLDFEWRFTAAAGQQLLGQACSLTVADDRVLLLGTPSLAALAIRAGINRSTTFLGEDNAITASIVARNKAARNPLEVRICGPNVIATNEAGLVVLDPPWYFDFIRPMLAAAAAACRPGGHILLSAPSIGSASSAAEDRSNILRYVERLSLDIVAIQPTALTYETPFFEANALAAAGVSGTPPSWRRGDLFVLRKRNHAPSIGFGIPARKSRWRELVIGRMRVFVTRDPPGIASGFGLRSIVPGDVLPAISRRDPRRKKAGVWTSGNRIFGTVRPDLVLLAGERVSRFPSGDTGTSTQLSTAERDEVERLSYALLDLARHEEAEERRGYPEEAPCRNGALNSPVSSIASRTTNFG
jgi:hypothetical protein